jgi:acetolactate synthase-1/2/3 large subunit
VFNNCQYGTIRMHQESRFPDNKMGNRLSSIDFVKLTESLGGVGFDVAHEDDFPAALHEALNAGVPATIAVSVDPGQISVGRDQEQVATTA